MLRETRPRQVHPFYFAVVHDRNRGIRTGNPRDAFAAQQAISLLAREGYELGDAFLNFPGQPVSRRRPAREEYTEFDESRMPARTR